MGYYAPGVGVWSMGYIERSPRSAIASRKMKAIIWVSGLGSIWEAPRLAMESRTRGTVKMPPVLHSNVMRRERAKFPPAFMDRTAPLCCFGERDHQGIDWVRCMVSITPKNSSTYARNAKGIR